MRLLIISHTPHYRKNDQVVGWGSTVREIDHLATLFDEVVHIAPLHPEPDPGSSLPYQAQNVRVHAVKPSGGNRFIDKLGILPRIPAYLHAMLQEMKATDIVHVRCPAAISLIALILLVFIRKPVYRWVKYAGNWQPDGDEAVSYKFQRWLIKLHFPNTIATINGSWNRQPRYIKSFQNPSMSNQELLEANQSAKEKKMVPPVQLLFVGRLESAKGVGRINQIARLLGEKGINFEINLIGDGPEKTKFLNEVKHLNLEKQVHFHGWIPRTAINPLYQKAHIILLPSFASEGWPKVLSEAMAYGTVVLASNISSIPQILTQSGAGYAIDPTDIQAYADKIIELLQNPEKWKELSQRASDFSRFFTYNHYLSRVLEMVQNEWDLSL